MKHRIEDMHRIVFQHEACVPHLLSSDQNGVRTELAFRIFSIVAKPRTAHPRSVMNLSVCQPTPIALLKPSQVFMPLRKVSIGPGRSDHSRVSRVLPVFQPLGGQTGVVQHGGLVHVHLFPVGAGAEPAVLHHLVEEGRAGVGRGDVEQGDVERQLLGVGDGLLDRLLGLAGQADDEVAPVVDAGRLAPSSAP